MEFVFTTVYPTTNSITKGKENIILASKAIIIDDSMEL